MTINEALVDGAVAGAVAMFLAVAVASTLFWWWLDSQSEASERDSKESGT